MCSSDLPAGVWFFPAHPFRLSGTLFQQLMDLWKSAPSRFQAYSLLALYHKTYWQVEKLKGSFTTCQHFHSTTTIRRTGTLLLVFEKKLSKNYWLCPASRVPCGLPQSRSVPIIWDKEKTCTQKGTSSLSMAIRIVTPCLPGTSDGTHTDNRPNTFFIALHLRCWSPVCRHALPADLPLADTFYILMQTYKRRG